MKKRNSQKIRPAKKKFVSAEEDEAVIHRTVLLKETVEAVNTTETGLIIDATLGFGGHSELILEMMPQINVCGIDQDNAALAASQERLNRFGERFKSVKSNFSNIKQFFENSSDVRGVIADLGVSSWQFDTPERGFSFRFDAPLDMRMDAEDDETPTAAELLATLDEEEIANLIYQFGEERKSRRIARRIVEQREAGTPVETTKQLADLVEKAVGRSFKDKIHPATRTFQALRIAVNREIEILEDFLHDAVDVLAVGGKLAVISFHSLEDRIVKQTFRYLSGQCVCPPRTPLCLCGTAKKIEILTRRPLAPSEDEISKNPRSRSAKLRIAQKISS